MRELFLCTSVWIYVCRRIVFIHLICRNHHRSHYHRRPSRSADRMFTNLERNALSDMHKRAHKHTTLFRPELTWHTYLTDFKILFEQYAENEMLTGQQLFILSINVPGLTLLRPWWRGTGN